LAVRAHRAGGAARTSAAFRHTRVAIPNSSAKDRLSLRHPGGDNGDAPDGTAGVRDL